MKTSKLLASAILIAFLAFCNLAVAQTYQVDLHATLNDAPIYCLEKTLSGEWTYHVTYHVDKKTGHITKLHWNVKDCDLYDSEGNKYKIVDTGNDGLAFWWDYFNEIKTNNVGYNVIYDQDDNWLPLTGVVPMEGSYVGMMRFIGNGEVFWLRDVVQFHINAKGDVIVDFAKGDLYCNW